MCLLSPAIFVSGFLFESICATDTSVFCQEPHFSILFYRQGNEEMAVEQLINTMFSRNANTEIISPRVPSETMKRSIQKSL